MRTRLRRTILVLAALTSAAFAAACIEPPPVIPSIPASGLKLRVFAFGYFAENAVSTFDSVTQNNPSFAVVQQGGDGEVLIGLEQDTPSCVEPTALCSLRVSYRVKNPQGVVVKADSELVSANSDRCMNICERALTSAIGRIVDKAAVALKSGAAAPAAEPTPEPSAEADAGGSKGKKGAAAPPPAPKASKLEAGICSVGTGPRLPSEEAERRVGQVEALKRLGVIDNEEFECLRKAYLARL
jgi:hypothetical protein